MATLRIHHTVKSYDGWRRAFDSDPMDRKGSGVRRYHVHRASSDANFVTIDLEFDTVAEATEMLERLRRLWTGPASGLVKGPEAWVLEPVESKAV